MSYENEARTHFAMALFASGLSLAAVSHGLVWAALPVVFSVGWSGASAWMLKWRNMRPRVKVTGRPQGQSHMVDDTKKGEVMTILNSADDFEWYMKALDVSGRYEYAHTGKPEKYPCKVISNFWDDPNGPYTYHHLFIYQQVVKCEHCGHETLVWPEHVDV